MEVAQTILRHEDVETTRAHYLMLKSKKEGSAAMKRLERVVRRKLDRQASRKRKSRINTNQADVAQLVEQPIRNRQVSGSSPLVGSISNPDFSLSLSAGHSGELAAVKFLHGKIRCKMVVLRSDAEWLSIFSPFLETCLECKKHILCLSMFGSSNCKAMHTLPCCELAAIPVSCLKYVIYWEFLGRSRWNNRCLL